VNSARRQRFITPIVILLLGGGLAIWASQRETERHRATQQMIMGVCETAMRGGDVSALLATENDLINETLGDAIAQVCAGAEAGTVAVSVRPGDGPGHSGATHVAMISVVGVDRLGLRLAEGDGRSVIIGFWWPE
jgi:hypothetical protein